MAKSADNLFFKFVEEADKLGQIANSELNHSNGVTDKESAKDAIKEYGELLKKVNEKFDIFKATAERDFNIE